MTKTRVLALLAALWLLFIVPTVASAQQVPPHVFIGTVTINGLRAPIGTTLIAYVDGVVQGSTTVQAGGTYKLMVNPSTSDQIPPHVFIGTVTINGRDAPLGTTLTASIEGVVQGSTTVQAGGMYKLMVNQDTGGAIRFKTDNLVAAESATWEPGGATILDLNAGDNQDTVNNQDHGGAISFKTDNLADDESATREQEGAGILDLNPSQTGGARGSSAPPSPQSAKGIPSYSRPPNTYHVAPGSASLLQDYPSG